MPHSRNCAQRHNRKALAKALDILTEEKSPAKIWTITITVVENRREEQPHKESKVRGAMFNLTIYWDFQNLSFITERLWPPALSHTHVLVCIHTCARTHTNTHRARLRIQRALGTMSCRPPHRQAKCSLSKDILIWLELFSFVVLCWS